MRSYTLVFRFAVTLLLFYCSTAGLAQTIPASRLADWKSAGCRYAFDDYDTTLIFSGITDGQSDNSQPLNDLILSQQGKKALIIIKTGSYYFSKPIHLIDGITLRGEKNDSVKLRFMLNDENHLILAEGERSDDTTYLTEEATRGESRIVVSNPADLGAGDFILLSDDDSALVFSEWARRSTGQILEISHTGGDTVFLTCPLRRSYTLNNHPVITRIEPAEHISIENLSLERLDTTSSQTSNIYFNYCVNSRVKCVQSRFCNYAHIEISHSSHIEVNGSYFREALGYGDGGKAYGVLVHFTSGECLLRDNIFDKLRHSLLFQAGANGNAAIYNYSINPYWTQVSLPSNAAGDIVLHGNYAYANLFEGNVVQNIVIDNSHGKNGPHNVFFRNRAELYGIFMNENPASDSQTFVGNEITNKSFPFGNYILKGTGHFEWGNNVKGTVTPSDTMKLSEVSLILDTIPEYYKTNSAWPPVGIPNNSGQFRIESQSRQQLGHYTPCYTPPAVTGTGKEPGSAPGLLLYPNPASGTVAVTSKETIKSIQIFSTTGQLLLTLQEAMFIDISGLPPGLYFVIARYNNGQTATEKLLVD